MGHFRCRSLLPLQDLAPFQKGQSDFWRGRGTTAKVRESSAEWQGQGLQLTLLGPSPRYAQGRVRQQGDPAAVASCRTSPRKSTKGKK